MHRLHDHTSSGYIYIYIYIYIYTIAGDLCLARSSLVPRVRTVLRAKALQGCVFSGPYPLSLRAFASGRQTIRKPRDQENRCDSSFCSSWRSRHTAATPEDPHQRTHPTDQPENPTRVLDPPCASASAACAAAPCALAASCGPRAAKVGETDVRVRRARGRAKGHDTRVR